MATDIGNVPTTTSGSGAPTTATFITQTADGTLSAEQALGSLATGIVKNTTTTGVLSIAVAGTDYVAPAGTAKVAIDLTGNAADVPLTIKNGKANSGVEVWVTGSVLSGFMVNDSSGVRKAALSIANATDDWLVGAAANDTVVEVAASKRFLVGNAGGRHTFAVLPSTGGEVRFYDSASTAKYLSVIANSTASGEFPAGAQIAPVGTSMDLTLTPEGNGVAGRKLTLCYYRNTGWSSALEIAHTSGGAFGTLLLMKSGGNVGIGVTPNATSPGILAIGTASFASVAYAGGATVAIGCAATTGNNAAVYLGQSASVGVGLYFVANTTPGNGEARLEMYGGNTLKLRTNSADRLTIDSVGNIVASAAALATNATDGFLYIPTCAGTPTGTPTTYTGRAPLIYDSTNHKLYIYDGGWKGGTAPGAWS